MGVWLRVCRMTCANYGSLTGIVYHNRLTCFRICSTCKRQELKLHVCWLTQTHHRNRCSYKQIYNPMTESTTRPAPDVVNEMCEGAKLCRKPALRKGAATTTSSNGVLTCEIHQIHTVGKNRSEVMSLVSDPSRPDLIQGKFLSMVYITLPLLFICPINLICYFSRVFMIKTLKIHSLITG